MTETAGGEVMELLPYSGKSRDRRRTGYPYLRQDDPGPDLQPSIAGTEGSGETPVMPDRLMGNGSACFRGS